MLRHTVLIDPDIVTSYVLIDHESVVLIAWKHGILIDFIHRDRFSVSPR